MLIGLTGKKRSGKGEAVKEALTMGFCPMAFSPPVKAMVREFLKQLGYTHAGISQFEANKEDLIPEINQPIRHLWQSLGTDWGRNLIDPNIWIFAADLRMRQWQEAVRPEHFIFEDIRFENEARYIRHQNGLIIHIERIGLESTDQHESENGIMFVDCDERLINDNLDDYLHRFRCLVESRLHTHRAKV